VKAIAVLKLTYLQMLGYDMSWAAFHIVEVIPPGFGGERFRFPVEGERCVLSS